MDTLGQKFCSRLACLLLSIRRKFSFKHKQHRSPWSQLCLNTACSSCIWSLSHSRSSLSKGCPSAVHLLTLIWKTIASFSIWLGIFRLIVMSSFHVSQKMALYIGSKLELSKLDQTWSSMYTEPLHSWLYFLGSDLGVFKPLECCFQLSCIDVVGKFLPDHILICLAKLRQAVCHAEVQNQASELEKRVSDAQSVYDESSKQLEIRKQRLRECDGEIAAVVKEKDRVAKQMTDCSVDRKKAEHKWVISQSVVIFLSV